MGEPTRKATPSTTPAPPVHKKQATNTSSFKQVLTSWRKMSSRQWKRLRKTARRRPGMFIATAGGLAIYLFVVLWCIRQLCCQRRLPPVKAAGLAAMARADAGKPKDQPSGAEPTESASSAAANCEDQATE